MANKAAIIAKVARNLKQRGLTAAVVGDTVQLTKTGGDVLVVSYVDKQIQKPLGGIDGSVSPFIGIGVAAPGALKVKGAAAETTLAAIFDTAEALALWSELSHFANDMVVESGASTAELAYVAGHPTVQGLGS